MNIHIIFRGPTRPSPQKALHYAHTLINCFQNHHLTTHLWSWDSPDARSIAPHFHHSHLSPEPNPSQTKFPNTAKQFLQLHLATQHSSADFVVQTRLDTEIQINPDHWLNPHHYTTIHAPNLPGPNQEFINDQFGIATPNVIKQTFNYHNLHLLYQMIQNAHRPEDVLQFIVNKNKVPVATAPTIAWSLDPNRHQIAQDRSGTP